MNLQINQLVKSLLQKESLDQCSMQELKQFADRYPYFGAAQLLLTKKLQTENAEEYNEQLQKTFLFFHNPLWVEQLLNETGQATVTKSRAPVDDKIIIPEVIAAESKESDVIEAEVGMSAEITGEIPTVNPKESSIEIPAQKTGYPGGSREEKNKDEFVFEPFYTVDYFASQGIKYQDEEKPKDKFGQQLKSFTEWIKTMKRLPVSEIMAFTEPKTEQKVEHLAEHSLEDREVLTEAMAEVWEKQGNAGKAIEIYAKLSLLDPPKSVYFAAKIEELKKKV